MNGYEDVDRNMFFKLKEGSKTTGNKAALVKEQCRLDMRKYSFSQRVINEWNKLPNDCVNASSVNMFKNRIDRYMIRAGYTYDKIVGLLISQLLPCPLAIWNLLFGMAILFNLAKPIEDYFTKVIFNWGGKTAHSAPRAIHSTQSPGQYTAHNVQDNTQHSTGPDNTQHSIKDNTQHIVCVWVLAWVCSYVCGGGFVNTELDSWKLLAQWTDAVIII